MSEGCLRWGGRRQIHKAEALPCNTFLPNEGKCTKVYYDRSPWPMNTSLVRQKLDLSTTKTIHVCQELPRVGSLQRSGCLSSVTALSPIPSCKGPTQGECVCTRAFTCVGTPSLSLSLSGHQGLCQPAGQGTNRKLQYSPTKGSRKSRGGEGGGLV